MSIDIIRKGQRWGERRKSAFDIQRIAHPMDRKIISILKKTGIKGPLEKLVEQAVAFHYGTLLATGVTVDDKNFPELYGDMKQCAKKIGISVPYTIITNEMNGINAAAMGTDASHFIIISNMAPRILNEDELKFIIAHECGHIAMKHMVYHTAGALASIMGGYIPVIGPAVSEIAAFPLNYWNRCSEITADRIGLICCGSLEISQRALLKIVGGLTNVEEIDITNYIQKSKTVQNMQSLGRMKEYFQTHPLIYKRLEALELFEKSEIYSEITGKTSSKESALDTESFNSKIEELLRVY